jgi:hypothetical protein
MRKKNRQESLGQPVARRKVLASALAVPLVAGAGQPGWWPSGQRPRRLAGTSFYVCAMGSDSANGRTPATAWATIARVNQALAAGTVSRGDSVHFRCGETFYGTLSSIPVAADTEPILTFDSFGSGARPVLSNYKICTKTSGWVATADNVWRIDLSAGSGAYTGNTSSTNTNVGFLRVAGAIKGGKKFDLASLAADWDFYSDNSKFLYVRAPANPALSGDVRAAVDGNIVTAHSSTAVRGLELRGSGGHGFRVPGLDGNIVLDNCVIHEIGGSQLIYTGGPANTRYGNGVEIWIGASNVSVTGNEIADVYDVAVTCQGTQTATQLGWNNVHITGNQIHNCTQSFEMWCDGTTGTGFVNCSFANNTCSMAGYSWAAAVRPDKAGKSTHLLFYDTQLPCGGLAITGNSFHDAAQNYSYLSSVKPPAGMVVDHNTISLLAGTKLEFQRSETIEQASAWTAATGLDVHSTFSVI